MPSVNFYLQEKIIPINEDDTILDAARKAGIIMESPCNGQETCGKCKVKVDPIYMDQLSISGQHHLTAAELSQGYVLACGVKIRGDILVELISSSENQSLQILSFGNELEVNVNSYIEKQYDELSGKYRIFAGDELIGIEEGLDAKKYGVVVDIGTTTLVATLFDLSSGQELATSSVLNPQTVYAQDVLSRIKIASETHGLDKLHEILIAEINRMISELVDEGGIIRETIYEIVFCGNTCMLYLAAGISPYSLGKYPYTPDFYGGQHLQAADINLSIAPFGIIYFPSIISAYVGADISAGVLASELYVKKGVTLLVDIGTNGEMVLGQNGLLAATSTAAGPAFEGMNINHGMRAANGAIEYFDIDEQGIVTIRSIADQNPLGICGSGILDIVGELAVHGLINKSGKFADPAGITNSSTLKERLVEIDGKMAFCVAEGIYISQKDIRQVQLAKGAIRAGIEFLLRSRGITAADVDKVLIAGSFGYHLQAKSLLNLGLLPREFVGKIEFIGNSSKSGGRALLLNRKYRNIMDKLVKEIEVIELSGFQDFDKVFVQCLAF